MYDYFMFLTAMTGDDSKLPLIAVCLVASIVLIAALIIIGKVNNKDDEEDEDEE